MEGSSHLRKWYLQGCPSICVNRRMSIWSFFFPNRKGQRRRQSSWKAKMRGGLCCTATGTLSERLKIRIPLKEFPMQGIAEFTLYNADGQPMAERLVYVHPERKLHIELNTDSARYFTRGKGKLNVKVTDEKGNPVQAHLGLSIFDRAYQNELNPENMLSYCYLSTEIKGNIHNPAYYFDSNNKDRQAALRPVAAYPRVAQVCMGKS